MLRLYVTNLQRYMHGNFTPDPLLLKVIPLIEFEELLSFATYLFIKFHMIFKTFFVVKENSPYHFISLPKKPLQREILSVECLHYVDGYQLGLLVFLF